MEIDWFFLSIICGIACITIIATMGKYFEYKTNKNKVKEGF
jgi:hypothetical protein